MRLSRLGSSLLITVLLIGITGHSASARESSCGFGYEIDYYFEGYYTDTEKCTPILWRDTSGNDGFVKYVKVGIQADNRANYDADNFLDYYMALQCASRKLIVMVFENEVGMYADTNRRGLGTAQLRFNEKKILRVQYGLLKDWSGIYLRNTKAFTSSLLKSSKVSFKIPTASGSVVVHFPTSNISEFTTAFKSAGCPLA